MVRSLAILFLTVAAVGARAQSVSVTSAKPKTLTSSAIAAAEKKTSGLIVGSDKKSLSVGSAARLVVRTGPKSDMMSYRIKGMRNPTINAKPGAKLRILFVNADDDMLHNLRFAAMVPPFDAKIGNVGSSGSSDLPHMTGSTFTGQELTVTVPSKVGTYYYLCTIPGHAAAGMFGKLVVQK